MRRQWLAMTMIFSIASAGCISSLIIVKKIIKEMLMPINIAEAAGRAKDEEQDRRLDSFERHVDDNQRRTDDKLDKIIDFEMNKQKGR
jgi:hypothetical protein